MSVGQATSTLSAAESSSADATTPLAPKFSVACAALGTSVAAYAMSVLAGHVFDVPGLRRWGGAVDVSSSCALTLLFAAVALLLLRRPRNATRRATGRTLAALAAGFSALVLLQDLTSSWLAHDPGRAPTPVLGWMPPNAALPVLLVGLALALLDVGTSRLPWPLHEPLAILAGLVAFLALLGYLYGVSELYWLERATAMRFSTAVAILVLSTAVLLVRLDRGIGGLLASEGLGGAVARRLLPATILIPTLIGLARLSAERMGLLDPALATALVAASTVLILGGVTLWSASALGRVDSARVRTMHALRDESVAREVERRQLRAILDVLPVAVFISDASGRVVDASREASAIWGGGTTPMADAREGRVLKGWDARTGEPLAPSDWPLARALATGRIDPAREIDIETFEGGHKTILEYAAPIRDERSHVVGGVAVTVDITERKRAERELAALKTELEERVRERTAELLAANAELEAFSYSVSHDLRAPLRWIDGFARALEEDHAEELGPSGREYLRQLHESVARMTQLIDALLWLSRVTTRPIDREPVDLGALAREIAGELSESDPTRRVDWVIADDLVVTGDGRLLRVVLDNLLRNAWKFTGGRARARIEVGHEVRRGEHVFFVKDDGVGFDESYADRLFRPFERLHAHEEFEGTGIGLALVRRIVVRHGGRVWAEGKPDEGAAFYFTLAPRKAAAT